MMKVTTIPLRGGPNPMRASDDPDGRLYGRVYGYQSYGTSYYYQSGYYDRGLSPYWSFQNLSIAMAASYQDGQMWFGDTITVNYGSEWQNTQAMTFQRSGGFTVNPDDQLVLNTTIAQWSATDGSPYYVQLQTGDYNGMLRNCWHVRLPGILRQACTLWDMNAAGQTSYTGDYLTDDSNLRYSAKTFVSYW